jgi:hypothetical protein
MTIFFIVFILYVSDFHTDCCTYIFQYLYIVQQALLFKYTICINYNLRNNKSIQILNYQNIFIQHLLYLSNNTSDKNKNVIIIDEYGIF